MVSAGSVSDFNCSLVAIALDHLLVRLSLPCYVLLRLLQQFLHSTANQFTTARTHLTAN